MYSYSLLTLEEEGPEAPIQKGFWVPNRVWATSNVLNPLRKSIAKKKAMGTLTPMTPVMQNFKQFVICNSIYRMWVESMIQQANGFIKEKEKTDPDIIYEITSDGDVIFIESFDSLFEIMNEIVTTSPAFNDSEMVSTPMNGLFAICMGTEAGTALFHDSGFNKELKKVLDSWNTFLKSADSLDKLDIQNPEKPGSWISQAAYEAGVWCDMQFDLTQPAYGFDSWNQFFTRKFVPGARKFSENPDYICIGCETTPWKYADNVSSESDFWVKHMPYSLLDIFGGQKSIADLFQGGQIYQGFLSATRYHRWQCPLDGDLLASWVEPGTYFAQRPNQGENEGTWEGTLSQPYLGHVATRAIFIFNHPKCGLVAMICIGMVEVSTCFIRPEFRLPLVTDKWTINKKVKKGEEMGMFEYGGSTHMLVFEKDKVELANFATNAAKERTRKEPIKMGTVIAKPSPTNISTKPNASHIGDVRILAALVNTHRHDEVLEKITLINIGSSSLDLDMWTISVNGEAFEVLGVSSDISLLNGGEVRTLSFSKKTGQITNGVDSVIELKDSSGNMVHSVSYNSERTKKSGYTILF